MKAWLLASMCRRSGLVVQILAAWVDAESHERAHQYFLAPTLCLCELAGEPVRGGIGSRYVSVQCLAQTGFRSSLWTLGTPTIQRHYDLLKVLAGLSAHYQIQESLPHGK